MLSRALRIPCAPPLRQNAFTPLAKRSVGPWARRTVTTDAASSHAEKEHVPEVSNSDCAVGHLDLQVNPATGRRQDIPSQALR